MNILLYTAIFFGGAVIGVVLCLGALGITKTYDGVIKVIFDEEQEKITYSLELFDDPNDIMFEKEILFKVETTSEEESDRE